MTYVCVKGVGRKRGRIFVVDPVLYVIKVMGRFKEGGGRVRY